MVALSFGLPDPVLHYSSISHGDIADVPSSVIGIVGLAGPAVTTILTLFACGWVALRGPTPWAVGLSVAAVSRFVVGVPYTLVNATVRLTGGQLQPPAFDEHKAGLAVGWSGDLLLGATAILLMAVLGWIAVKLPRGERLPAWLGLLVGTGLGWGLWMTVVGPVLLP